MQLVDQKTRSNPDRSCRRRLYAALIDSLFQNSRADVHRLGLCAAVAAVMTALKTGNVLLWPCAAF